MAKEKEKNRQFDEPDGSDLHVNGMGGGSSKKVKVPKSKSAHFTAKMLSLLAEKCSEEDMKEIVKKARAYSGGMSKSDIAKLKSMAGADYDGPDEEPDDDVDDEEAGKKAHEVADLCAKGQSLRLFIEASASFAEPPEWMPLLPKPGNYQHPEYGEIKITKGRNQNFIDNFKAKVYQSSLPVNAEHAPDNSGAYGWIEDLRMNEDGSVDARMTWTDKGREAIRNDRYRYVSAEWADSWEDPQRKTYTDVLRGAALTVRPYFKDKFLRPLVASERGLFLADKDDAESASTPAVAYFFSALTPSAPAASLETKNEGVKQMAEDLKTGADSSIDAKAFAEMQDQVKTLSELAKQQDQTIKSLSETNTKLAADARLKRFTDEVKGKNGNVAWHGEHEKQVEFLEKLAKAFGEDSEEIKSYINQQRTIAKQMAESNLFTEVGAGGEGSDSGDATAKIDTLVRKAMSEDGKLSLADATARVIAANPQLYREHSNAHTVRV